MPSLLRHHPLFRLNSNPASAVLSEINFPSWLLVVWSFSLVRPITFSCSSRTRDSKDPQKPSVTDPIMRRWPSRTYSFLSICPPLPPLAVYGEPEQIG